MMAIMCSIMAVYLLLTMGRKANALSPKMLLVASYSIFILLGGLAFEVVRGISYTELSMLSIYVGFISLSAGVIVGGFIFVRNDRGVTFAAQRLGHSEALYFILLLAIFAFFGLVVLTGVPIFAQDPSAARINFTAGKGHIAIFYKAAPVVCLAILYDALARGGSSRIIRSHMVFAAVTLSIMLTGARGPTAQLILAYSLMWMLVTGYRPRLIYVLMASVAGLTFMSVIGSIRRFGSIEMDHLLSELAIIVTARAAAIRLIEIKFPSNAYAGWTAYFYDLQKFLPGISAGRNAELKSIIFANSSNMHEMAGINPSLVGESIVNIGPMGPYIVPAVIGLLAMFIFSRCLRYRDRFFWVATYCFFVIEVVIGISSGITPRVTSFTVTFIWIAIISVMFVRPKPAMMHARSS